MIIDRKNKYKGYLNIDEITYKTNSGEEVKRELMVRQNAVAALLYDTIKEKYILISRKCVLLLQLFKNYGNFIIFF
jgi:hypothetical protein